VIEFTGERVIPGQVDPDLWNEHLSRYAFARRLAHAKRVLDAGCGSGYGAAMLAEAAAFVTGVDVAPEAIQHAREHYPASNVRFLEASCAALPLTDGAVDLVVAFEVVEHLQDWRAFLREARRVLARDGLLVISTPNRAYYAESRRLSGPNPYHVHEFDAGEFCSELQLLFPHVHLYFENHVAGIAFQPAETAPQSAPELHQASSGADAATAHFLLAVCSEAPEAAPAEFLYIPSTANILHEREEHIDKLERWVKHLNETLAAAQARIVRLQSELEQTTAGYEAKVSELEADIRSKTEWAHDLDAQLHRCVDVLHSTEDALHATEKALTERIAQLNLVRISRWVKLGNRFGLGPQLPPE
jgi:SAM-dependent methyltransferase